MSPGRNGTGIPGRFTLSGRSTARFRSRKDSKMTSPTIAPGVRIGHVHLKVADLDRALDFYVGVLGFELMQRFGDQAAFVAAGGYHHHLGLNTWRGEGVPPMPSGVVGMRHWTIVLDTARTAASRVEGALGGLPRLDTSMDAALLLSNANRHGMRLGFRSSI